MCKPRHLVCSRAFPRRIRQEEVSHDRSLPLRLGRKISMFASAKIHRPRLLIGLCLLFAAGSVKNSWAETFPTDPKTTGRLTQLSLEQLGNTEVTTVSKEPVKVTRTPAAVYVITKEDIERSGATSIPEALRLVPGVEVARIDSN